MSDVLPILAEGLGVRPQRIAVIVTLLFLALVIELVRRRRLVERYALLWMGAGFILLVLSVWTGGLDVIANLMGIQLPANAIFILAFAMAFLLLLNFSVATSRLSEETKILAQEAARLDHDLRVARGETAGANGVSERLSGTRRAEEQEHERPVETQDAG